MSKYELQVLDSYQNKTYADGQAGAIYGQFPPLVNASLPPGEWQTYDIVFHGPRFASDGKLLRPAHTTVLQNGVLVQDNVELTGLLSMEKRPPYTPHPENCRCCYRTTINLCGFGISGFASCRNSSRLPYITRDACTMKRLGAGPM